MQSVGPNLENLPKVGYYVSRDNKKEEFDKNESHIHKQGPLTGVKAGAHKFSNNILTYFPKGFQGSKNSDFYEFLSLGMFPYVAGSLTMIAAYCFGKKTFNTQDAHQASMIAKNVAAGVGLYAVGKWLSPKLSRTLIHATTGVNLDMHYLNKVNELPEPGEEKGKVRVQYPKVFDSVDFYRKDLLEKDGEINHNDVYYYSDKLAKKMGYSEKLNDSKQVTDPAIRQLKTRATAMENITKYVVAATGVLIGAQEAFKNMKFKSPKNLKGLGHQLMVIPKTLKEATSQMWKGSFWGKGMIVASIALTALDWLIPSLGFKKQPDTVKTKLDPKKESEVC